MDEREELPDAGIDCQEEANRRTQEFLDLYKQMEDALEDKYRNSRRHYSSVVFEFSKDYESAPVRDQLDVCREIRNLLTHNPNLGGEPVVQPSKSVVQAMREVLEFVRRPPLAIEFATKGDRVMKAALNQKVLRVMEIMDKNGFSHIPVMRDGQFSGVFSVGSMFRYLLKNGGKGITPETTIGDLGKQIDVREHMENYAFVSKDESYIAVRKIFERVRGRNQRISVVFVTETGAQSERLLGMLTPWDVLGDGDDAGN